MRAMLDRQEARRLAGIQGRPKPGPDAILDIDRTGEGSLSTSTCAELVTPSDKVQATNEQLAKFVRSAKQLYYLDFV